MAFRLSIEDGSYVQTLEVRSGSLTVGRQPPNGLALSSPGLSARHAVFRQVEGGVEIEALPTKIGVRLRGERIDRAVLVVGDSVQMGWAKVSIVEVTAIDAADAPAPVAPPAADPPTTPLPTLEFADEPPVLVAAPPAASRAAVAEPPKIAVRAAAAEPPADFVVLSRKAIRVLPWWGISVALHALAFGALLLLPAAVAERAEDDSTFAVTLRRSPTRVDLDDVPPVEPSRRGVDLARPDVDVAPATPDSTLPPSSNPKGKGGTGPARTDEPELVVDGDAGSPWAQTGGSTSIGAGTGGRIGAGIASNLDETFGKDGAGKANAAAAGRLNGDPFTRSLVNGLKLRTTEKNVKVVKGDYDQGELVMEALGLRHGFITAPEMANEGIDAGVRAIFYNCTGRAPNRDALANLARWVEEGGWLFTSDWGVDLVIDKGFPGYIRPLKDGARAVMTPDETITFTVAPGKHLLLAGLPAEAETARWWLEDSSIPFTIEKPESVEVLVQSADLDRKYKSKYVAVTFPHGKGRVVHVLGHMYQKEGNLRGAYAMQRLLLNFLYQAIKGDGFGAGGGYVAPPDRTPPVLKLPSNVTAEATTVAGCAVTFAATATDNVDGDVRVTCSPVSGTTFALGSTTVECSATDATGNVARGSFTVAVRDTTPPALSLPANIAAEATSAAGRMVVFAATATDAVSGSCPVACSTASGGAFALGATTVECSTRDAEGNSARGSFVVTIRDTTAPEFRKLSVSPTSLEPKDHQMVRIAPTFSATDAVTAKPSLVVVSVVSSEADEGLGVDDVAKDVDVRADGEIYVRAERSPAGAGRVYTLTFRTKDGAGNLSAERSATVTVP